MFNLKTPACFVLVTNFLLQGANLRLLNFACLMIGQGNNKSLLSTPIHSYPPNSDLIKPPETQAQKLILCLQNWTWDYHLND